MGYVQIKSVESVESVRHEGCWGALKPTDYTDDTDVRRRTGEGELFLINDEGLMMTEDLMDYILSGYKLYENKGET